jgi:hypothetical protein
LNLYVEFVRLYLVCVEIVCNIIIYISNCPLRIKIRNYFFIPRICISSGSYLEQLLILTWQFRTTLDDSFCRSDCDFEKKLYKSQVKRPLELYSRCWISYVVSFYFFKSWEFLAKFLKIIWFSPRLPRQQ